jgi:predicted membrane-bound spermidine synthase
VGEISRLSIPFWKKLLSYMFEFPLETIHGKDNLPLTVCLHKGRFQLYSENAIYSWDDLYTQFRDVFNHLDSEIKQKKEVLLLGLGLGSIPYLLENKMAINAYFTAIELDENIIYLAEKYTLQYLKSGISAVQADALAFPFYTEEKFDLICFDVFNDHLTPIEFFSREYFEALNDCLEPEGLLLFNVLRAQNPPIKNILSVFPKAIPFKSNENDVWIARKES